MHWQDLERKAYRQTRWMSRNICVVRWWCTMFYFLFICIMGEDRNPWSVVNLCRIAFWPFINEKYVFTYKMKCFLMLRNCHGSPSRVTQLSAMWFLHDAYRIWPKCLLYQTRKKTRENNPTHNKTTIMLLLNCKDNIQDKELQLLHSNCLFGKAGELRRI